MTSLASLSSRRGSALNERRTISVELPEFAIRAIQYRVDLTNEDAASDALMRQTFFDGAVKTFQVVIPDFGTVAGPFQITSLEFAGQHDAVGAGDVGGGTRGLGGEPGVLFRAA